ncbi:MULTISPECIES: AbrB/MazE/SpoVT family DNA-binding domain-containing protein [Thiomicrorhabdus]|uniref:AbrB/MazE/SpoVT family DNA-binding domain-containing protein n=1 Tax=Thiomicrorhabdus heinhorstiae TaxID=2748010 RepID=A0ABS0BTV1_9GAMM|nr:MULTISPECIES: AbrB/MazE/SpoVT family DNA-binding domain-containing protein [Thiomicrorhabdus]MBF6057262.1 AbrB/MazE/SpoVT family DNA-binding domain-containing protein [Thiomicrorhabdus heinhorstiae]
MQTMLRKIGNSRGIIIPSSIIEQLNIENEVDMNIKDGTLVLKPSNTLRKGWFDNYNSNDDVEPLSEMTDLESEQEDWEW